MKTNDATRASAEAMPSIQIRIGRVQDALTRAQSLNELIFMAGESISIRNMQEAITTGCDLLKQMLVEADEMLDAIRQQEGGAS